MLAIFVFLSGCQPFPIAKPAQKSSSVQSEVKSDRFYEVETGGPFDNRYAIYVDRFTGCQYITKGDFHSGFELILNADGKPYCSEESK
ncbi:DUF6440 family protein [Paenibacillus periandrae]|uniref:DUF6440 family protein n=1 Tax=Paenibacillus periandrae TaxID=1761741 RepID=UPI001F0949F7|nr:DUF6440 family protein [Paenibacillus periandrae]